MNDQRAHNSGAYKSLPILPSSAGQYYNQGDAMDVTQSGQQQQQPQQQQHPQHLQSQPQHNAQTSMGPPLSSPNGERSGEHQSAGGQYNDQSNGGFNQPVGAAAAAQQPKVVQTAFIHKLYK